MRRKGEAKAAVAGLIFVVAMWWGSMVLADVHYEIGFQLVTLAFPALVVWHTSLWIARGRRGRRTPPAPVPSG